MPAETRRRMAARAVADGYVPQPYTQDPDETVQCPECDRMNDPDASYCDQCGYGSLDPTMAYREDPDEVVVCPNCQKRNDLDAHYCDQCGIRMENRTDVRIEPTDDDDTAPGTSGLASKHPRRNLVRARFARGAVDLRDDDASGAGTTLFGVFSEYETWYEVNSFWEGTFLERVAPGAFARTIAEDRGGMRCCFDHGMDPEIGDKPLGPITTLRDTPAGPYYEVPLLATAYNRDSVLPMLRGTLMNGDEVGSQLGASFRFTVDEDTWENRPVPDATNPLGLPKRTILAATVYEFGPVTFPANPAASAGVRSESDRFLARLATDARFLSRFQERVGPKVTARILAEIPDGLREAARDGADRRDAARRWRQLQLRARAVVATGR